ncbi:hypothetical protein O6P43_021817 [Quillaja saponaria]|uniref:Uncharacterized protein n=1 Tax=Quillaja saponaria TaxID=32244 RepID=A0AAD7PHJ8_QUISA|nr:hypothetical protein O6P43_021817 [Quillaja saponaria]
MRPKKCSLCHYLPKTGVWCVFCGRQFTCQDCLLVAAAGHARIPGEHVGNKWFKKSNMYVALPKESPCKNSLLGE